MEAFYLNGWQYVQQGRRCNKPACRCKEGELHGPYWYKRSIKTREQVYVGRALPPAIVDLVKERDVYRPTIASHIAQLAADQELLQALIDGSRPFTLEERHRLEQLGYGCLNIPH